jgi:hypothetical protein
VYNTYIGQAIPLAENKESKMTTVTKVIPKNTKIYTSLERCCRYQFRLPGGVRPIFDAVTKSPIGFASLPEKQDGEYLFWVK